MLRAPGLRPLRGADPSSPARAEQYMRCCQRHTGRPPTTPPQPSGSTGTSSRRGLLDAVNCSREARTQALLTSGDPLAAVM